MLPFTSPTLQSNCASPPKTFICSLKLGKEHSQKRDWKGETITLLVILLICLIIYSAVFLLAPFNFDPHIDWTTPSPENVSSVTGNENSSQVPVEVSTSEIPYLPIANVRFFGNNAIIYDNMSETMQLSLKKMKAKTLFRRFPTLHKHEFSHDLRYVALFARTSDEIHTKFNTSYNITILDRKTKLTYKVGIEKIDGEAQRIFEWNPTGSDYIFWQDGHLYYCESPKSATSLRISRGDPNWEHGIFDWVYEEEIFGYSKAAWWSKKGKKLAFLSRNKAVEKKTVLMKSYPRNQSYPIVIELPYPKTHEKVLPTYVINLWDKRTRQMKQMDVQLKNHTAFRYLYGVKWVVLYDEEVLVATWANRLQTHIFITVCVHTFGICKQVFEYKYLNKTWAEPCDFASILSSNEAIYILLPREKEDGNSYQHIAKLVVQKNSIKQPEAVKQATMSFLHLGNYDVVKLNAYDKDGDTIYFTALAPSPTNRHLYSTKGSPTKFDESICVSCRHSNCTYQRNELSPDFKHIITKCMGPAPPRYYLGDIIERKAENMIEILKDKTYEELLAKAVLPTVLRETVPLKEGYEALVKIELPRNQQIRASSKSLPVLVHVYAGPGSQMASEKFTRQFGIPRNFAVVSIDGRGSNGRGWKYRSSIYGALGTVEIEDQIEGIRQVMKKYPFLDDQRLSVFGWSYGGFAAALMSEKAPESFFKCTVSIAPVANFLYYDATYTERYMGDAGQSAYDAHDITLNVTNFHKTRLLLIHGMYDDNVHFQNSALFIEALQRETVDFDLMIYPDNDHSISFAHDHLFQIVRSFLNKCAKR